MHKKLRPKTNEFLKLSNGMNRKIATSLLITSFLLISINSLFSQVKPNNQRVVVLDAGHGGDDSGAVGQKSFEKNVALAITLKVGNYIQQNLPNVKVVYTRDADFFVPLDQRAAIANKNNADLFVSIHANSNKNTKAYGTESFAMGLHKSQGNLEVAQKENSVIILEKDYNTKYEGFDPNSAESYIIFSMMQNMFLEKSLKIASMVQNEFKDRANRFDRGVKQAGFLVLWHTKMPSVLIETGFISNPEEELFLNSASGQDYLASAIYRAIKKFLDETENESKELDNEIIMQKETQVESQLIQNSGLIYRVQVTSSSKKMEITDSYFKNYQDIYEYVEGDTYKYTLGSFSKLSEVKEYQKKIKDVFPDAFIVAFNQGKKITMKEAKQLETDKN